MEVFEERLAELEGAEKCWATSSGMSALFTILMSYLKKGDRVLFGKYSGTEVKVGGDEYLVMREDDIMGVVE